MGVRVSPPAQEETSGKFGIKVKEIRLKIKKSQADLTKILGLYPTFISGVERGVRNIALMNIEKLVKAIDVSVRD